MRISGQKTMRLPGAGAENTVGLALPPCPICQTPGVPGEAFCPECGFLAGSTPGRQPGATAAPRSMPRLLDETGIEYVLHAGENIVGRDGADVILNSRTVSRRHAVLRVSDSGTVRVEDTNSTNGTRCGGVKVPPGQPVALSDGVIVQFGEVKLTAVLPPPPAKPDRAYPALPSPYDSVAGTPPPPLALMPPDPPVTSSGTIARLVGGDGTAFPLGDGATSFGRRAANTYVLSGDTYVSGAHAIVEQDNGRFYLVDLGSTNGTRLNGRRIAPNHPEPLSDGDEVLLGQTPFTFRFPGH